jgi:predicted DNA-binding protein
MNERAERFRQQLQKELGLTVGPKDPLLAEFLAHEEFREELAGEHQRLLLAFEEALAKNRVTWSESAKNFANQSLNVALGTARERIEAFSEEAGRRQAAALRATVEQGVERLEKVLAQSRRIAWLSIGASSIAIAAAGTMLLVKLMEH